MSSQEKDQSAGEHLPSQSEKSNLGADKHAVKTQLPKLEKRLTLILTILTLVIIVFFELPEKVIDLLSSPEELPVGKYQVLTETLEDQLEAFSHAISEIGNIQRTFIVATNYSDTKVLTRDTFRPEPDIKPLLFLRKSFLEFLTRYVNLLNMISRQDLALDVDVEKAREELSQSIKLLIRFAEPNARDEVDQIQKKFLLIQNIRDFVEEGERADALKKIMDANQPHIEKLSKLVVANGKKIKMVVDVMFSRIFTYYNYQRFDKEGSHRFRFDMELAERIENLEELFFALASYKETINTTPRILKEIRDSLDTSSRETKSEASLNMTD